MNRAALSMILFLSACAGAPVGWGGTHQTMLKNPAAITIAYDPLVGGYGKANQIATEHCRNYNKYPVPTVRGKMGALPTQTFECRK